MRLRLWRGMSESRIITDDAENADFKSFCHQKRNEKTSKINTEKHSVIQANSLLIRK